jgi:uncharacterized membrane protein YhhN
MPLIAISLVAVAISAFIHIRAEYRGPRRNVYIFKPLTTSLIILTALLLPDAVPAPYKWLIIAGLLFSLGGDVFLMLPQDRFVFGLVSFLIAHLFYIAAFTRQTGFQFTPWVLAAYLIYGGVMLYLLWPHLGSMKGPVTVYMAVILVMGWQATERWLTLGGLGALLAAVGAILFVISDSTLALDKFRGQFASARTIVLTTYFAAQWLIALSVAFPHG